MRAKNSICQAVPNCEWVRTRKKQMIPCFHLTFARNISRISLWIPSQNSIPCSKSVSDCESSDYRVFWGSSREPYPLRPTNFQTWYYEYLLRLASTELSIKIISMSLPQSDIIILSQTLVSQLQYLFFYTDQYWNSVFPSAILINNHLHSCIDM